MICIHLLCVDHEMCLRLLCDTILKCTCFVVITVVIVGEHDLGRLRFVNSNYIFSTARPLEIYLA